METTIFYILIGILVFDYELERLLAHLNASRMGQPIPNALAGLYDPDKYDKQQLLLVWFHQTKQFTRLGVVLLILPVIPMMGVPLFLFLFL